MDGRLTMPELSAEEFAENVGGNDFFRRYGNPVWIREKSGDGLVCMAREYYERMLEGPGDSCRDGDIRYWNYEFEMPQEAKDNLEKIAADNEMTTDEFFEAVILSAIQHPAETAEIVQREQNQYSDEELEICLVRQYPVHKGETRAQARKRAIAKEEAEERKKARRAEALEQKGIDDKNKKGNNMGQGMANASRDSNLA